MNANLDRLKKGSRPLYISLGDAFAIVSKIYEQGGGQASKDMMSRLTGNSISSSSFQRKNAALKSYGLISEENETYALTEIGMSIAAPTSPQNGAEAKKNAFLSLDIFAKVYDRHKGKLLPADEFLKNIIEQDFAVSKDVSKEWVSAVKDGLRTAGLLYDRGDGKLQIMESPTVESSPRTVTEVPVSMATSPETDTQQRDIVNNTQQPSMPTFTGSGHTTKIALSNKRFAFICIPDTLNDRDAKKIKSALSGISTIVDSLVDENAV